MRNRQTPVLLTHYRDYLESLDSATFVTKVSKSYSEATLERLALHGGVNSRRAAVLALTFMGEYRCNATMGQSLWDPDRGVRMIAEDGISQVWLREGCPATQSSLRRLFFLNQAQRHDEAVTLANRIIQESPYIAEAHHQLSSALFALDDYCATLTSAAQAIELNPYHFLALSKMGDSYLQLNQTMLALGCFERALRLNPNREDYRIHISRLRRSSA